MAFRNCYHKDCPTPKMYVSPIIPKTTISNSYTIAFDANVAGLLDKVRVDEIEVVDEKNKGDLKNIKLKSTAVLEQLKLPVINREEEFEDYIVVYCDSDHKNIIPIAMPEDEAKS